MTGGHQLVLHVHVLSLVSRNSELTLKIQLFGPTPGQTEQQTSEEQTAAQSTTDRQLLIATDRQLLIGQQIGCQADKAKQAGRLVSREIERQTDRQTDRQTSRQADRQADSGRERQTDLQRGRQADTQMNGRRDGEMYRQMD